MADRITTSLAEAKILVMEGQAGYSPQIEVLDITGGHQIRITTKVSDTQYRTDVFNVMDGEALDSDAIAQAVADYLSTHPISAPVTSVNGKTGEVDLDADDVSAATSQVSISGNVITIEDTARGTIAAYAITPASIGAGTYSKPSGGIPASDLASGVIPAVPQMATQTDMSDWTSGKTVDAAVLKVDFTSAIQRLGGVETSVDDLQTAVSQKADSADIPTKTSDLTNDSGFQTAAQVQSAIAAIPDELPTVTASDNGKFLRVVSGAWEAATIPAAESASFGGA